MKNIAILSTMYYPDMGAPSAVIDRYVQQLENHYHFWIITKTYKNESEFEKRDNVRYITSFRHKTILWCEQNIKNDTLSIPSKLILCSIKIYKLLATQFLNPTANNWENKAYYEQLVSLNKEHPLDCVISVSNTAFCQFAAMRFRKMNPKVKWLTFITDPFAGNYIYYRYKLFPALWKRKNLKSETSFYLKADHNFMSEEMYRFAKDDLHIPDKKLTCFKFVLNNKYSELVDHIGTNTSSCRLVYAGALYRDIRNPEYMLEVISHLENVCLDLYVNTGECEEILGRYTKGNITRQGFAPKEKYDHMICCEYDILVNIGNISTLQSPSKTLDLLSTGKPLLNFYFVKDKQYEMIEKYPLGLNIKNGECNVYEKVERFCSEMKGKRMPFEKVLELYPENNIDFQTELFKRKIEES